MADVRSMPTQLDGSQHALFAERLLCAAEDMLLEGPIVYTRFGGNIEKASSGGEPSGAKQSPPALVIDQRCLGTLLGCLCLLEPDLVGLRLDHEQRHFRGGRRPARRLRQRRRRRDRADQRPDRPGLPRPLPRGRDRRRRSPVKTPDFRQAFAALALVVSTG
jgi:hypothetical protein